MVSYEETDPVVFWQIVLRGQDQELFSSPQPSARQVLADDFVEYWFSPPRTSFPNITTSTLLSAAWGLVSSHQVNTNDVVFFVTAPQVLPSVPASNGASGETMTTVPLKINAASHQTVSEYLQAVQQQHVDMILQLEGKDQKASQSALLQTSLLITASEDDFNQKLSTNTEQRALRLSSSKSPLTIELCLGADKISARATFSSEVFPPSMVRTLLERIDFSMHQLATASSEWKLAEVDIVSRQDLDTIWQWNSSVPKRIDRCVHDIIKDIVHSQPDASAVCAWDGSLTYGELDRLATKLASKLVSLGVQIGTLLPLCFEKSMWTAVAVLGTLKAGGAFLLLDPSLPEKRLQNMVQKINASLILSSRATRTLSSRLVEEVVIVDSELITKDDQDLNFQLPQQNPSSLMYVLFTSGSMGVPKCVMITHANVASALYHQIDLLRFTKDSRILDFSSYSFTTTISNIFGSFAAGGCLCVPNDDDRQNKLAEVIRRLEVNTVDLTPSVMQFLVPEDVPTLQVIIFGGEAISPREIKRWWGKVHTIHLYGQSECTSNGTINHNPGSLQDVRDIGKGAGLVTWVVDQENHNKLVPVGSIGELLLEGPIVGCGYLNEPEKTAAVFIEDPPWLLLGATRQPGQMKHPGRHGRLYKTGDLVRYNENGNLTFFGRKDTQVKIHGQRVELGEVEHWVKKCTSAKQTVAEVVVPRGGNSSPILVVFLENHNRDGATEPTTVQVPADVEAKLAEHLPAYMIPTAFLYMRSLPRTATGKMNRKELREIGAQLSVEQLAEIRTSRSPKRLPTSELELSMQKVWALVLNIGLDYIGLDDNFFHLGGDSIAAIKVISEARKFGVRLAVADIFHHPVLHDVVDKSLYVLDETQLHIAPFSLLDKRIDVHSFLDEISSHYDFERANIQDAYPCTSLQEGLIAMSSKRQGDYIEQSVLELAPLVAEHDLRKAWARVVHTMPILRTRFVHHSSMGIVQVVLDDEIHWNTAIDLSDYLEADRKEPMDLGQPLVRYALVKDDKSIHRWFVWTIHHALYDGWSVGLIMDAVYRATRGDPIEPGPQFQSFIKYIKEQDSLILADYWRQALDNCEFVIFPTLPPTIDQPLADKVVKYEFQKFKRLSKNITTPTLIRAAWALVIGRLTSSNNAVFGITTSGRNTPVAGVEAMVAPTFATIPLRINLARNQKVSEYLDTVQQQSVNMVSFEQAGLHHIAKMSPDCRNACMFQSLLIIQPQKASSDDQESELGKWKTVSQHQWLNTYALMLEMWFGVESLQISASYDGRVLESQMVYDLLSHLEYVMQQLDSSDDNYDTLAGVNVMTTEDLEQIWIWNGFVPASSERCIHHIVHERALAQPTAPAICAWDGELTYIELDQLTTRLGNYLVDLGIQPNTLVPLCFEKSMWTVIAMLAVLKAGAGFVLLEQSFPEQRLQAIAKQLKAEFILSSPSNTSLSSRLSKTVIQIGPELVPFLTCTIDAKTKSQLSSTPMFAVFTSGTTGNPKGVVLSHSNFCSGLKYQCELLGFTNEARVFDFAAYSFDIAVHNVFATLATGGCLCVPAEKDRWGNIGQAIADMRATIINLTPSVARLIDPLTVPHLKTVILAGEPVSLDDITRWWGRVRVVNAYGPAECHISTVNGNQSTPEEAIRIGRGAGLVTWVVEQDNHHTLLPPGYIGELLLEGPLVGLGYLDDPQKTATAFVEDPEWLLRGTPGQPGRHGRLYKTGDLVRYNTDGSLTFIGRKDTQVKIRGQRVELGEVEHYVLKYMPAATAVVAEVIVPRGKNSSPVLVVFLEIVEKSAVRTVNASSTMHILPIPTDIEANMAKHLPRHMRPSAFVSIQELPRTATGKTDRRQLQNFGGLFSIQELMMMQTTEAGLKRQPTSATERQMQMIWADVLGLDAETIGLDDNFFQIGGDSIAVMKVVEKARKAGIEMAVIDVFHNPSLSIRPLVRSV